MTDTRGRFVGQAAIVTGASRGIGHATAVRFAAEGASMLLTAVESGELDDVVGECRDLGADAVGVVGDLSDSALPAELARRCLENFSRVDVLVNNAFWDQRGAVDVMDLPGWDRTLRVSLTAAMLTTREVLPFMVAQGGGAIVNVTSQRAFASGHGAVAYETAKAGMVGLTRSTAVDFGAYGVRSNCVSPGMVLSDRVRTWYEAVPSRQRAMHATIPLGRPGQAEEVAAVILFVASGDASYVNGAVIAVDGGALAGLPENAALQLAEEGTST